MFKVLILLLAVVCFTSVNAKKCYECNSDVHKGCGNDFIKTNITTTVCEGQYCRKFVGKVGDKEKIFRGCKTTDDCILAQHKDIKWDCHDCNEDQCNGSFTLKSNVIYGLILLGFVALIKNLIL